MDNLSKFDRHKNMIAIKSKNTKPEMMVRKLLFSYGLRYRIHYQNLPGKPDIVLKKFNLVININGCFWHHHQGCIKAVLPKSNKDYWKDKIKNNISRDKINHRLLKQLGWNEIVIWECQTNNINELNLFLRNSLNNYLKTNL